MKFDEILSELLNDSDSEFSSDEDLNDSPLKRPNSKLDKSANISLPENGNNTKENCLNNLRKAPEESRDVIEESDDEDDDLPLNTLVAKNTPELKFESLNTNVNDYLSDEDDDMPLSCLIATKRPELLKKEFTPVKNPRLQHLNSSVKKTKSTKNFKPVQSILLGLHFILEKVHLSLSDCSESENEEVDRKQTHLDTFGSPRIDVQKIAPAYLISMKNLKRKFF